MHQPPRRQLKFRFVPGKFAVCKLAPDAAVPDWSLHGVFTSVTRTAEELSIVCPAEKVPSGVAAEAAWTCFKLEGPIPFDLTAVLVSFVGPLSHNGIPIFAISTYDTDYVLVREEFAGFAMDTLREAGHEMLP